MSEPTMPQLLDIMDRLEAKRERLATAFASYKAKEATANAAWRRYMEASEAQSTAWKAWEAIAAEPDV